MQNVSISPAHLRSNMPRCWISDTVWATAANVSQAAGSFLGMLILARLQGLEAAGHFAYALAITAPLAQLMNFQLKALILTHSDSELPLSRALSVRAATLCPSLILCAGLALLVNPLVGTWLLARLVDSWAEVFQAQEQRSNRMPMAAISTILRASGLCISLAVCADVNQAAFTYAVFSLLLLVFDWRFTSVQLCLAGQSIWPLISRGSVLGMVLFLQSSSASLPRIFLEHYTDSATLGMFATLTSILQAGNLAASSFGQGLLPLLPCASIRKIAAWAMLPFAAALLALILSRFAQGPILEVLNLSQSPASSELLFSLFVSQLVVWPTAMIGYALTAKRLYSELISVAVAGFAASALTSYLLISDGSVAGAANSMTVSAAVTLALCFYFLARNEVET